MLHWIHQQWLSYWWPSDLGNGPEAIQEMGVVALVTSLVYPPMRHYVQHEFEKLHHKIDYVLSGSNEPYVEPEWKEFEHWVSKLVKRATRPFRKKTAG